MPPEDNNYRLGEIAAKLDAMMQLLLRGEERANDHELRIRSVEKNQWKQAGAFTLVGVALAVVEAISQFHH